MCRPRKSPTSIVGYTDSGGADGQQRTRRDVLIPGYNRKTPRSTRGAEHHRRQRPDRPVTVVLRARGSLPGAARTPTAPGRQSYVESTARTSPASALTPTRTATTPSLGCGRPAFYVRADSRISILKASNGHMLNTEGETATVNVRSRPRHGRVRGLRSDGKPYPAAHEIPRRDPYFARRQDRRRRPHRQLAGDGGRFLPASLQRVTRRERGRQRNGEPRQPRPDRRGDD